jgi:hypothetical protein
MIAGLNHVTRLCSVDAEYHLGRPKVYLTPLNLLDS